MSVLGASAVKSIAAGTYHSLAVRTDGSVLAFGWNGYGQLGTGDYTSYATPAVVSGLGNATMAAAFAGTEDLQAMALDEGLPAVVTRAVVAELVAGARDADLLGACEETDPVTEDQVIIRHEGGPPLVL